VKSEYDDESIEIDDDDEEPASDITTLQKTKKKLQHNLQFQEVCKIGPQ